MKPTLSYLESISRGAGEILRGGFDQKIQIEKKGVIDLVTDIDRKSEEYLLEEIRARFRTVNFAHGIPIFSVSIAYSENGRVILGAVYDPIQDEYFCAERGGGAWLNGKTIKVSGEKTLDQSLLVTGFSYDIRTNPVNNLDQYVAFSLRSQGVRRLGSAALDLAYIAAGRLDGFWEISIYSWDIAAGSLIVEEAGGKVTDVHGGSDFLSSPPSVLATNSHIHTQMLTVLEQI